MQGIGPKLWKEGWAQDVYQGVLTQINLTAANSIIGFAKEKSFQSKNRKLTLES